MITDSDTFCVLPFISRHIAINGKEHFCCLGQREISEGNSLYYKNEVAEGRKIAHCSECYKLEEQGGSSIRQRENNIWMQDEEVRDYVNNWSIDAEQKVFFYDVRYSNKCNLACISCKPEFSSLWEKSYGITVEKQKPTIPIEQMLKAKRIYLAGGEPLVIDEFLNLLEEVANVDEQPEIVINTNLTRVSDKIRDILSRIKNLTLTISVDAYGKVNEYHRYPMSWDKFLKNFEWAKTINCTLMFNSVVDAISILNIHRLVELEGDIMFWTLTPVVARPWLEVQNLPEEYKEDVIANLEKLKESKFYEYDVAFAAQVRSIINQVRKPGDSNLFVSTLLEKDEVRGVDYKDYLGIDLGEYK